MKTYINRYNQEYTFTPNELGNIQWSGDFTHSRFGFIDNPTDITMVDPSGGPYVTLGTNMTLFGLKGKVAGFIPNKDGYEIVINKDEHKRNKQEATGEEGEKRD
jgi:hypothetical protein